MKKCFTIWFFLLCPFILMAQNLSHKQVMLKTDMGDIVIELYDDTPIHRDNFLKLVKEGVYDGVLFHRVINKFMIQAGDPTSKDAKPGELLGEGDLGYTLPQEIHFPKHYHIKGVLAAAREGDDVNPERASSSSQFYIVTGKKYDEFELKSAQIRRKRATGSSYNYDQDIIADYERIGGAPHLDGQYTIFGEVIKGMRIVEKIQKKKTDDNDRPKKDIRIIKATIIE